MPLGVTIFLIAALVFVFYQVVSRLIRKSFHFPAPAFIGRFLDSPFRKVLQSPEKLIKRSGIGRNMIVLEIGCGSGAFITVAAREAGPAGKIYALDVQENMLKQLKRKLNRKEYQDIDNVEPVRADAYQLPFKKDFFDLVYLVTVLPEIPDQMRALKEIDRVLKPNGILSVSEFMLDPDYPFKLTTIKILSAAGFRFEESSGNSWSYTVRFRKPAAAMDT